MTLQRLPLRWPICLVAVCLAASAISSQPASLPVGQLFDALPARSIGPANMGGRITDLAVVESNPAIMYIAAASGGVWKTNDNGVTWRPINDNAGSLCTGAVAIAPTNPDIVWIGSGEGNILRSVSTGDGVYKSTDGGKSFKHMGLKETRHIARIVIHPKNPDIVYIAALGHAFGPNNERGVFRTSNGGKTWEKLLYINDSTGIADLAMDPAEPDVLYACAYTFRRDAFSGTTPRVQFGPSAGLFKTADGGKTWERLKTGLPARPHGRCGISIYRKNPNIVFALIETDRGSGKAGTGGKDTNETSGIFRSDDKGKTWDRVSNFSPTFGFFFGQIRVDPLDDQRVYVLDVQLNISTDGGKTLSKSAAGHADNHALWINPKNTDHVVLGNDGGLFVSKNKAKSWQAIRGFAIGQYYAVCVDMRKPYRVYGGLQDNGSWGTPSATHNQAGITLADSYSVGGGDGFYCQVDPTDPDTVYCEMQMGGLTRVDLKAGGKGGMGGMGGGGKSIKPRPDANDLYRFNWNSPILISPHAPKTLYFGGQFLFKSTDRGDKWKKISPDLTHGGAPQDTGHTITTIAESPKKAGILWVGTDDGRVHVSRDGGKAWKEVTKAIPPLSKMPENIKEMSWVTRVECSHHAEGTAYVTVDRHRNDDLRPFAFKTTDYGATWKPIVGDLPKEGSLHCIRESSNNPDVLFVGTEFGLYGTLDGGQHWHHMKTGIPPAVVVHDLVIHPRERDLVVGTHGRGIYIVDISHLEQITPKVLASDAHLFDIRPVIVVEPKPKAGGMDASYAAPNPPYGATICYYLKSKAAQPVTITVMDKSGKILTKLDNAGSAGMQKAQWNLRGSDGKLVAPGEYTARLQIGDKMLTKTVVVEAPE